MKKILFFLFLQISFTYSYSQIIEKKSNFYAHKIDSIEKELKSSGINDFLFFIEGCNGCETTYTEEKCGCSTENIFDVFVIYNFHQETTVIKISCCVNFQKKLLLDSLIYKSCSLSTKAKSLSKKKKGKFYPPIALHQPYYQVKLFSKKTVFDFVIHKNQMNTKSQEYLAWIKIPGFKEKLHTINLIQSFLQTNVQ